MGEQEQHGLIVARAQPEPFMRAVRKLVRDGTYLKLARGVYIAASRRGSRPVYALSHWEQVGYASSVVDQRRFCGACGHSSIGIRRSNTT